MRNKCSIVIWERSSPLTLRVNVISGTPLVCLSKPRLFSLLWSSRFSLSCPRTICSPRLPLLCSCCFLTEHGIWLLAQPVASAQSFRLMVRIQETSLWFPLAFRIQTDSASRWWLLALLIYHLEPPFVVHYLLLHKPFDKHKQIENMRCWNTTEGRTTLFSKLICSGAASTFKKKLVFRVVWVYSRIEWNYRVPIYSLVYTIYCPSPTVSPSNILHLCLLWYIWYNWWTKIDTLLTKVHSLHTRVLSLCLYILWILTNWYT